ncbi:MAG: DUF1622 domain-containing protein [Actinobacteria bacterium]|nr:DUF1622 domain-containing protein [Actinomycetota bacterium]
MDFTEIMDWVSRAFETAAVAVLIVGFVIGVVRALRARTADPPKDAYQVLRSTFGRSILLGLEIFVAADLIRTVVVDQTWQNVIALGLIVLIRTFLSFSLEVEMDGVWPWRRRAAGAGVPAEGAGEQP